MKMNKPRSHAENIGRRGELMAELFMEDLGPTFVARTTVDFGYDLFVGFMNSKGGVNITGVQVKATERIVTSYYVIDSRLFARLAYSNIPGLLLVADVKQNRLFYAWPTHVDTSDRLADSIRILITEINDNTRVGLLKRLIG